jgi:hypothetical protein
MKRIILIVMVLLLVSSVSAFKVNYYHYKINQDDCELVLSIIPEEYYKEVLVINFYIYPSRIKGSYLWNSQMINIYDNCNLRTLIHELSHHKNKIDGIDLFHSINHNVGFRIAEREIWESLN